MPPPVYQRQARPAPPRLDVVFLGTSAASSLAQHPTSAMLLRYGDDLVLVDCGARTLSQLRRSGIDPTAITAIALTHWHGDHVAGLPMLLSAAASKGQRTSPLRIYAPPAPRSVSATLGLANGKLNMKLLPLQPGDSVALSGGSLAAIRTDHAVTSLGYVFAEAGGGGRRIVFSGDTRPSLDVMLAARGADLLIHEATFASARGAWANRLGHCTAAQAALIAKAAGVGALALTHISARDDRPTVLREARVIFPDATMPEDLDVIEVVARTRRIGPPLARRARVLHSQIRPLDDPGLAA